MAEKLTVAEAKALAASLDAERAEAKKTRPLKHIADPEEPQGDAPSERAKAACTTGQLRDYIASLKPQRPSQRGNVRCPSADHEDATPSCAVGEMGGTAVWHCHGCGASGSIIDALMVGQGLAFEDAVRAACEITGANRQQPRAAPRTQTRARPAHQDAVEPPRDAVVDADAPSDAAQLDQMSALTIWESPIGAWALASERLTGFPAMTILRAAMAEASARTHGWRLGNQPLGVYAGIIGASGAGKTQSTNVAKDSLQYPEHVAYQTDYDEGLIADFVPESAEGLLDELSRGLKREGEEGEPHSYPAAICRIDEGEFLYSARMSAQQEAIRRDLRSLWSGQRIKRRRKQSADTPPRILNHRPTVAMVLNLTEGPASVLLRATTGDATRIRLALAHRLTDSMAENADGRVGYEVRGWGTEGKGAVEISEEVAAEKDERDHAYQMAVREGKEGDSDGHLVNTELRDAAVLAYLNNKPPGVWPEEWLWAQELTQMHDWAAAWVERRAAAASAKASWAKGAGQAVSNQATRVGELAEMQANVEAAAKTLTAKHSDSRTPIPWRDATQALSTHRQLLHKQLDAERTLTEAVAEHLVEVQAWKVTLTESGRGRLLHGPACRCLEACRT